MDIHVKYALRLNMQAQVKDLLLETHRYFQLLQLFAPYVFILLSN